MRPVIALLGTLTLALSLPAQSTKFKAKDAGEIDIKYGTPTWREELFAKADPGSFWRLGSNGATTIETAAALVSKDGTIFPGTYNLAVGIGGKEDGWSLLFHRDGPFYQQGPKLALFGLAKSDITDKTQIAKRLQIDLEAAKDKALKASGGAAFRIRFGPHQLDAGFRALGTMKKKVTVGKSVYTVEAVKLPAVDEFKAAFEGKAPNDFTFVQIFLEGNDKNSEAPIQLKPGETPAFEVGLLGRTLKATRTTSSSSVETLKLSAEQATVRAQLGTTILAFELEDGLFTKRQTGASTPGKSGN